MIKEWFIKINGKEEGPYTPKELKRHPLVTPDTLVKKKDQIQWTPIRFISELKEVFEDDPESKPLHETPSILPNVAQDQATLAIQQDPSQLTLWLILLLILFTYILYRLYG